jgi:hypothetical protein
MAAAESPDLIPMDMSLPVIDGWEAARRVRENEATRKIRSSPLQPMRWRGPGEGDRSGLRRL